MPYPARPKSQVSVSNSQQADAVTRETALAVADYPHWETSSHQEQELRRSFYKALITAGVDGVVDLAQRILSMLRRARS